MIQYGIHLYTYFREINDSVWTVLPKLKAMFGSIAKLRRLLALGIYGGLILATVVFQGLTAGYYFSRVRHVRDYVRQTPPWVVDLQRRMGLR